MYERFEWIRLLVDVLDSNEFGERQKNFAKALIVQLAIQGSQLALQVEHS